MGTITDVEVDYLLKKLQDKIGAIVKLKNSEVLDKYDNVMDSYIKEVMPNYASIMDEINTKNSPILNKLFNYYLFAAYWVDEKIFPDDKTLNPLIILYSKTALSLHGIYSCLSAGLITEASILLRNLFESFVTISLITEEDVSERMKLYADYKYIVQRNKLNDFNQMLASGAIKQSVFDDMFPADRIEFLENKYEEIKNNYHPKYPKHWAWKIFEGKRNPTIFEICKKLGLEMEYQRIFNTLSEVAHSSPLVEHMITLDNSIRIAPFHSEHIGRIGLLGLDYCAQSVLKIIDFVKPELSDEVRIYNDFFVLSALDLFPGIPSVSESIKDKLSGKE